MFGGHRFTLGAKNFVAAVQEFPLNGLPARLAEGIAYLRALILDVNITAITQGGGGAATPLDLHNIIQQALVSDGDGKPWGPVLMNGQTLSEHDYIGTAEAIPFTDANGDAQVGAGAGPVARRFQLIYDYGMFGEEGKEFCPPCAALQSGNFKVSMQTANANTTGNPTLTATLYGVVYPQAKIKAVPRIVTQVAQVPSQNDKLPGSGMLLSHFLECTAAIVAADITNITLDGDGPILRQADVLNLRGREYNQNPEVTSCLRTRHFADPVGATFPRAVPVYPATKGRNVPLSARPRSQRYNQLWVGAPTIGNWRNVTTVAMELSDVETERQWSANGVKEAPSDANTLYGASNGNIVVNDSLKPYLAKTYAGGA